MKDFLSQVLDRIFLDKKEDLSSMAFVLPSNRSGVMLKKKIAKKIKNPIWAPLTFSVEDFVSIISGYSEMDNTLALFELYSSYITIIKEPDSFDKFYVWGKQLLNDFNDIDQNLVPEKEFFKFLYEIKKIEQWNLTEENTTQAIKGFSGFWSKMAILHKTYTKKLIDKKILTRGLNYRIAAQEAIDKCKNWENNFSFKHVCFIGLNALNKAEDLIIKTFLNTGNASVFFDLDSKILKNKKHEAGYFIRKNIKSFKLTNTNWAEDYKFQNKLINTYGVPTNVAQAKLMGNLFLNFQDKNEDSLNKTVVVLPDEKLLSPVLNSIPVGLKQYNITMGLTLYNTSIAGLVLQLLDACNNTNKLNYNNRASKYYYKDVISILSNPEVLEITKISIQDTIQVLNKENHIFLSKRTLQRITKINNKFLDLLFINECNSTEKILDGILTLISAVKEQQKTRIEEESTYLIARNIVKLQNSLKDYNYTISITTLKKFISDIFKKEKINFIGKSITGLQIMGLLETRALDFENVIILSVNEQILPIGKTNSSFIPFDVKLKYNLPTFQEKDAIFSYHFYRLLQRAKNIHLIYKTDDNIFEHSEKSRFIKQLENEWGNIVEHIYTGKITKQQSAINIAKDQSTQKEIETIINQGLSATAINTYLNCSLQFYLDYILKIKKTEEIDEEFDYKHLGTLVHETLESLYKEIVGEEIRPTLIKKMLKNFNPVLRKKLDIFAKNTSVDRGKNKLVLEVAKSFIIEFLNEEIRQSKTKKTSVKKIEQSITYDLPIKTKKVKLFGKIDRIDLYKDITMILDYKTGTLKNKEISLDSVSDVIKSKKKSKAVQLLFYAYLYHKTEPEQNIYAGIISFRSLSKWIQTLKISNSSLMTPPVFDAFEKELIVLLSELLDYKTPFTQTTNLEDCKFCSYKNICNRIE